MWNLDRQVKRQAIAVMLGAGTLFEKDKTDLTMALAKYSEQDAIILQNAEEKMIEDFESKSQQASGFQKQKRRI